MELYETLSSSSFLEYAFLRWVLTPAVTPHFSSRVEPQAEVEIDGHHYRIDYEIQGDKRQIAVELDGFEFHSSRPAFSYDRLRQNDLTGIGRDVIRFSYDSIRSQTARCVAQLQTHLRLDPALAAFVVDDPVIAVPEMDPDPLCALQPSPEAPSPPAESVPSMYFEAARKKLNLRTLRQCQSEAFAALANYYGSGGLAAACVMSVGSGKTALGVLACLAFTRRRALVVTPGSVIRGTFARPSTAPHRPTSSSRSPVGPSSWGSGPPRRSPSTVTTAPSKTSPGRSC